MFRDETVFVIGAGASEEFGLPVGWKLLNAIKQNSKFRFDYGLKEGVADIFNAINQRYDNQREEVNARLLASAEIHRAIDSAGSIDSFIDRNNHDELIAEVGKLQIAYAIAKAEAGSRLLTRSTGMYPDVNWQAAEKTWITSFTEALFDGIRTTNVETIGTNVTIICFNYDRCIEFYLIAAIERSFQNVSREQAARIVQNMNIIHPYGWLGKLPSDGGGPTVGFGPELSRGDLYKISASLVTWSETINDPSMLLAIKSAIAKAKSIVFLGFAFANQNMKLLNAGLSENKPYITRVYSTGYGLERQVEDVLKDKIRAIFHGDHHGSLQSEAIQIEYGQKCAGFMKTHMLNITV